MGARIELVIGGDGVTGKDVAAPAARRFRRLAVRLLIGTGLVVAGWLLSSALATSASAAEQPGAPAATPGVADTTDNPAGNLLAGVLNPVDGGLDRTLHGADALTGQLSGVVTQVTGTLAGTVGQVVDRTAGTSVAPVVSSLGNTVSSTLTGTVDGITGTVGQTVDSTVGTVRTTAAATVGTVTGTVTEVTAPGSAPEWTGAPITVTPAVPAAPAPAEPLVTSMIRPAAAHPARLDRATPAAAPSPATATVTPAGRPSAPHHPVPAPQPVPAPVAPAPACSTAHPVPSGDRGVLPGSPAPATGLSTVAPAASAPPVVVAGQTAGLPCITPD